MGPALILLIIIAAVIFFAVSLYNKLVSLRQQADNAYSQIDVQLKRRYDLIPNLVETVKGYMKHEQDTLERVIAARNRAMGAGTVGEKAAADAEVTRGLNSVFALSEAYPELRSNENMLSLQEELKSTENKIAFARQYYNDVVTNYNTARQTFPSSLFAGGFAPKELFEVESSVERENVQVKFT